MKPEDSIRRLTMSDRSAQARNRYLARRLAMALERATDEPVRLASRVGMPRRIVTVKETVTEKTRRILAECDAIMGGAR
jgi:hypothetical protein